MLRTSRIIVTAVAAGALALSPLTVSAAVAVVEPSPSQTTTTPTQTATPTVTPTPTETATPSPPPAPAASLTVSVTTPAVGAPFTFSCTGLAPGTLVLITVTSADPATPSSAISIAGEQATSKTAGADGVASGVITLTAAGTYTIVARDQATNAVLSSQTVTAVARAAPTELSSTGVDPLPIALGAAALIALGVGIALLARRRQAS